MFNLAYQHISTLWSLDVLNVFTIVVSGGKIHRIESPYLLGLFVNEYAEGKIKNKNHKENLPTLVGELSGVINYKGM